MPSTNEALASLSAFEMKQWLYLIILALVVYLGANLAQQLAIRRLGATTLCYHAYTAFPPSLASSSSSTRASPRLRSLGLFLVGTTATLYLGYQLGRAAQKGAAAAEAAKNKAADGGGAEDDAKGSDMCRQ